MADPRQDKLGRLHSLSRQQLGTIVDKWYCIFFQCERAAKQDGGFGVDETNSNFMIPHVLNCGHYVCRGCKAGHIGNKVNFHCIVCKKDINWQELENAPVAKHIQKLVPFFRPMGITCDFCTERERKGTIGFELCIRYPPELMAVYHNSQKNEGLKFDLPEDDIKGVNVKELVRKKQNEMKGGKQYKPYMCVWCSFSITSRVAEWLVPFSRIMKDRGGHALGLPQDVMKKVKDGQETKVDKKFVTKYSPWHLTSLAPAEMTKLLDELLMCPCNKVFSTENKPMFLECGHLCCTQGDHSACQVKECGRHRTRSDNRVIPTDIQYLLNLNPLDEMTMLPCPRCNEESLHTELFPVNSKGGASLCVYCAMDLDKVPRTRK